MLRLSALLGVNTLRFHKPVRYLHSTLYTFSIGQSGEVVAWKRNQSENQMEDRTSKIYWPDNGIQSIQPIYELVPSIIADADKLIDLIVTPLRLINNELIEEKVVTIHEDNRIRIWTAIDGLCINVCEHNLFPPNEKPIGLVQNTTIQSRFFLCFTENKFYIIDSWTMKIADKLPTKVQEYSRIKKARINEKKELEYMDAQNNSYRIKIESLFEETHLDVGGWISNLSKAQKFLQNTLDDLKKEETVVCYKKISEPDISQTIKLITDYLHKLHQENIWMEIFDEKYHMNQIIAEIISYFPDEVPTAHNCFFIKNYKMWSFFGTNKGRLFGIPAIGNPEKVIIVENDPSEQVSPIVYMNYFQNLLIVSWQNGRLCIYTIDNLDYTVTTEIQSKKNQLKQQGPNLKLKNVRIDININRIINEIVSSEIKYKLEIFCTHKGKYGSQTIAFQLLNNEVLILDSIHRKIINYRGIPDTSRVYAVLEVDDYIGIAHTGGVDLYSADRYQRTLFYNDWIWSDYQFCDDFQCKNDYHNISAKSPLEYVTVQEMYQFTSRHYRKKIDYYSQSLDFLYETFGIIDSVSISNQMYPFFHFIQKIYIERSIHSSCLENSTNIIRMKHNNIRRQKLSNTSYIYHANLNRQLQGFSNSKEHPLSENQFQKNFGLYSLFFWDDNRVPFLTDKYNSCRKKFLFKRRYCEQGIGKTFTLYFNNQMKHNLSCNLLTLSSVSSVALMQICSAKDFQLADDMISIVQNFNNLQLNVPMLSELSLSDNHNILKACINILMSAALTQIVPLHPLYEYFILNAKYLQETKQKIITETETVWFVYLGIGFIYSTKQFDQELVKILITRLIDAIDVVNFQQRPDLTLIILKVFNEGVRKWKGLISTNTAAKIFLNLFKIFFLYDGLSTVSHDDKKFNFCFEKVTPIQRKKMKQQIIKTIIYLSKQFYTQFAQVLNMESTNQKKHPAYPASIIQILKQYLKEEKPKTNLVYYIELLLTCLSPMTPDLRKYVQNNVISALQFMCSYPDISFNQPSQKLSLKTQSTIFIYCLKTSNKWRTISLKQKQEKEERKSEKKIEKNEGKNSSSILQMSPQGTYVALLSGQKLRIWRLSSGFWSGVMGAFSQGWSFEVSGIALKWDSKQKSITVINQNPSENKSFKL